MTSRSPFISVVDRFIKEASEASMDAVIQYCRSDYLTDDDIAYLAKSCAEASGVIWDKLSHSADVASTGGATSLTTLVCPLYLRAFGYRVPKLGVPGRPAGGVDVLAQIPNFKVNLTDLEARHALQRSGYVHFLAGKSHGSYDAKLFNYRKMVNALDCPPLVIASLLAKKLIVGLSTIGLDVRVAPFGNFGSTWKEARANAKRFCQVARILGVSAVCFLTDASVPYQPFVGRAESLIALGEIFDGEISCRLSEHLDMCYALAKTTSAFNVLNRPTTAELKLHFQANISAQGASFDDFSAKVRSTIAKHELHLTASREGFLSIDLNAIRGLIVEYQSSEIFSHSIFPDPVGLILKTSHGSYVSDKTVISTVRTAPNVVWNELQSGLNAAFHIGDLPQTVGRFEEVR